LRASLAIATQSAPQALRPAAHEDEHVPKLQARPGSHALPQRPQWLASESKSTHASSEQVVRGEPQAAPGSVSGVASEPQLTSINKLAISASSAMGRGAREGENEWAVSA
jgi:hypothetical protein